MTILRRATILPALGLLLATAFGAPVGATPPEWLLRGPVPAPEASPPLPPPTELPVQLVVDDDSAESAVGVGLQTASQFLWFNRFSPTELPFVLEEVWVLFPDEPNVTPGDAIDLAVWEDGDGDPTNGATLLETWSATVQVADGETFSIYPAPAGLGVSGPGDVLVGVVPRWIASGVDPPTAPAALDTTASQGRSWIAVWTGDPPSPAELPPDLVIQPIDGIQPGNWMIRAFGSPPPVVEVPTLDGTGTGLLALLLTGAAWTLLRRRREARR